MAIEKRKWVAKFGITAYPFPKVNYVGRGPFKVSSQKHANALMELGTYEQIEPLTMLYIAPVKLFYKDGKKVFVDKKGFIEYDETLLDRRYFDKNGKFDLDKEFIPA